MQIHIGGKHLRAEAITALDVAGREHLVIAVKATWRLPKPGQRPRPIAPQPLVQTDEYHGAPGESAMRYGADFARFKPRCDVLFDAMAHAPGGEPVRELMAGFKLGALQKAVRVVGPRQWTAQQGLSSPAPFTRVPLHHGLAFGGTQYFNHPDTGRSAEALADNPAGMGWAGEQSMRELVHVMAPQLEAPDDPYERPDGAHRAVALSAVGRHWQPRSGWAGTYDAQWQAEVFPLLPADFDEQYHQVAPLDQQMPYPVGGEDVVLLNLLPGQPRLQFQLPRLDQMKVRLLRTDYSEALPAAVVDTLYFEPEVESFSAVWRASVPIRRRIQEFSDVAVGPVDPAWWARKAGGYSSGGCAGCDDDDPGEG